MQKEKNIYYRKNGFKIVIKKGSLSMHWYNSNIYKEVPFGELKGKIIKEIKINNSNDEMKFITNNEDIYILNHIQICCEEVMIEDICGDLSDLVGNQILLAEKVSNSNRDDEKVINYEEDYTEWTFYKLSTNKGSVTIRWVGRTISFYALDVDFLKVIDKGLYEKEQRSKL